MEKLTRNNGPFLDTLSGKSNEMLVNRGGGGEGGGFLVGSWHNNSNNRLVSVKDLT